MDRVHAEDWLLSLAQQHRLSPAQRQIVQRMLGMFPDVAFLSTIEIAERTGVSQPTVTRLATALGFAGFPEFRAALRDVVVGSAPAARSRPSVPAVDQEMANLASLKRVLDGDRLGAAVALLVQLEHGVVDGSGVRADHHGRKHPSSAITEILC